MLFGRGHARSRTCIHFDLQEEKPGEAWVRRGSAEAERAARLGVTSRVVINEIPWDRIRGRVSAGNHDYTAQGPFDVPRYDSASPGVMPDGGEPNVVDAGTLPARPDGCAVALPEASAGDAGGNADLLAQDLTAELWVLLDAFHPNVEAAQHFMAAEGHGPIDALAPEVRPTLYLGCGAER